MDLLDSLQRDAHLLDLVGGVSVKPGIKARKIRKAKKSCFPSSRVSEDEFAEFDEFDFDEFDAFDMDDD